MLRVKIIPDKLFNKLWKTANKTNDKQIYIRYFTSTISKDYVNFEKYNLSYMEFSYLLSIIYDNSKLTFKDILLNNKIRKCDISNIFCIPIRTVEEWYTGNNKCPDYIRLMILRHYYLFNLGKYIYIESEVKREQDKPHIYNKQTTEVYKSHKKINTDTDDELLKKIDKSLESRSVIIQSTDNCYSESKDILSRTDYLGEIIKRRNKKI